MVSVVRVNEIIKHEQGLKWSIIDGNWDDLNFWIESSKKNLNYLLLSLLEGALVWSINTKRKDMGNFLLDLMKKLPCKDENERQSSFAYVVIASGQGEFKQEYDLEIIESVLKEIESIDILSRKVDDVWYNHSIYYHAKCRLDWLIVMKHINNKDNIETFCKKTTNAIINDSYSNGETALMRASKLGLYELAITLISAGANINAKDKNGKSVLNYAAEGGNTKIMELLLAQGAKG